MQPTRKLYYEDVACRSFCAVVLACKPVPGGFCAALTASAFYPEGGGQPADHGALGGARVTDVQEENGVLWHSLTAPLRVGETVQGDIDWQRRLDFMQQHTGEHIFSGILHAQYGCNNVGFHIGEDVVRMDFDRPLLAEELASAEEAANWVIAQGAPVETLWPDAETLASLEYRSKKELAGAVRIVRAGTADVCACCGTHVENCSRVGLVKVLSAQSYKGGTRVTMVCGLRAVRDYGRKWESTGEISVLLSAKPDETAAAVRRLAQETEALRAKGAQLEAQVVSYAAQAALAQGTTVCFLEGLAPDAVRRLALALCEHAPAAALCAAFSPTATGFCYALASQTTDVRPAAKQLNEACNGRGGGKPGLAQGSVQCSRAQLEPVCAALFSATLSI